MKRILTLLLLTGIFGAHGQDTAALKRNPYTLKIAVDNDKVYEMKVDATPYIFPDNGMQIYPGETIFVEVEQDNGVINRMRAVPEIRDSLKTLMIKFTQNKVGTTHKMMMLEIHNPFKRNLTYQARMFLLKQKRWVDTDVYPVIAGISAFETWNDIIITLGLSNWKFGD